ncbi:YitT family protein [Pediococcus claussenii]|uniref:DUF2179 domain-containing protein n=1 Tax=Pediococcus claussenii (strain ATCC BAA-344 / DSM 14800 / JCM 18046 / KCTC 3811 / LMG 21948 / P06) TaxID=701521 RepID=G8PA83_PEDCP|nr:YitT family protein [Pediococcus claussenii]AEV94522.1 hypothetical protein PECL_199 [Pediococcus claussenii ATCC BAA-344]ANZ69740.1 hypothetical protein AYR57_05150 [Pediococcus claussenii]ANZ71557.1 hypothetical protein AYR58_05155 [Pediococcus claussenii]KRN19771.1 hypothetical protein IV79_GL001059 [Pediococcus claussenii]
MGRKIIRWGFELIIIMIALEILAVSINMFYAPHNVAAGGATGISILLYDAFKWNRAIVVLSINIVMLILSWITLGRTTTARITIGSFLLPFFLAVTPNISLVSDRTLAVIVGGALYAIGIAILYQIDASSGGTTVPPLILKKYFNVKPALSLLVIDTMVCVLNIWSSGIEAFILALFSSVITLLIMNYVETGMDRKKTVYIISNQLDRIQQEVLKDNEQSFTSIEVRGGFSGNNREMLMVVVENSEYQRLINRIHVIDHDAFILANNVAEVHGGGF